MIKKLKLDKKRKIIAGVSAGIIATTAIVVPISVSLTKKSQVSIKEESLFEKGPLVLKEEFLTRRDINDYLEKRNLISQSSAPFYPLSFEWNDSWRKYTDEYYFKEINLDKALKNSKDGIDLAANLFGVDREWVLNVINNPSKDHSININGRSWSLSRIFISGIYTSKSGAKIQIINPTRFISGKIAESTPSDYIISFEDTIDLYKRNRYFKHKLI